MSYQIVFLKPASQELEDSYSWYENRKPGLGAEFLEEIEQYLQAIEQNPFLFQSYNDNMDLRRIPLSRFPFNIIYWVAEHEKIVYIDAVFHTKRKPKF